MKKYTYPVIFTYEGDGVIIKLPTFNKELYEEPVGTEVVWAKEILTLEVSDYLDENKPLPDENLEINVNKGEKVVYITITDEDLNSVIKL